MKQQQQGAEWWFRSLSFLCSVLLAVSLAMAQTADFLVDLHVVRAGHQIKLSPIVTALRSAKLRYELTSEKIGGAGRARTAQSGTVFVNPDQNSVVAVLSLSAAPEDRYTITLRLYENAKLVADYVSIYPQ